MEATHEQLMRICIGFKKYLLAAVKRKPSSKWLPDCSCGCRYYHELAGIAGQDWGVCWNRKSPRAGKLTFEHMVKCKLFAHPVVKRRKIKK
jgi:hypothetical protein